MSLRIKKPRITVRKPRVTVKPPRITVKPPRVTVGGDVGRVAEKVTDAVRDAVAAPVVPAVQMVEVIKGKPVDQAFHDAIISQVRPAASAADAVAEADAAVKSMAGKITGKLAGPEAAALLADFTRLTQPVSPDHVAALARSVELFVETLDLAALNPLAILIAAEIVRARNEYWGQARAIPDAVIAAIPEELRARASACRHLTVAEIGALNLPSFAIRHLSRASAVCLIDLIVFDAVPDVQTDNGKHYWTHELVHAGQYARWGVDGFAMRYVANEMSGGVNAIEEDADRYACSHFPHAQPNYIESCAV